MKKYLVPLAAGLLAATAAHAASMSAKKADAATPPIAVDTPTFVKVISGANEWEIESSQLAEQKSPSDDVKKVAAEIIKDHTKAGMDLKAALEKSKMPPLPEKPMLAPKQAEMLKLLQNASGADFDALYIPMQDAAHREAVTLFRNYAGTGDDKQVVAFAKNTLPHLEMHKMHVTDLVMAH